MDIRKLIADITRLASEAWPLPQYSDRAAVKVWAKAIIDPLIDLGYDAAGFEGAQMRVASLSQDEIEKIVMESLPPEKIGDGRIVKWISANLSDLFKIAITIISVIPK